jgi:hypothetical protein
MASRWGDMQQNSALTARDEEYIRPSVDWFGEFNKIQIKATELNIVFRIGNQTETMSLSGFRHRFESLVGLYSQQSVQITDLMVQNANLENRVSIEQDKFIILEEYLKIKESQLNDLEKRFYNLDDLCKKQQQQIDALYITKYGGNPMWGVYGTNKSKQWMEAGEINFAGNDGVSMKLFDFSNHSFSTREEGG